MFAQPFYPKRLRGAVLVMALLSFQIFQYSAKALTITNVTPVNVTSGGFTLFWHTLQPATPSVSIFADANGVTNLAGQLSIEVFPLHSGNPEITSAYEQRQSRAALQQKTRSFALMQIRATDCQPNTTYFYRVHATDTNGIEFIFPESGPLPSVTTATETRFVTESKHLLIDIPGADVAGRVVTLHNTNATYAISAVAGDGAGTNQVFLNLNDLFAQVRGTNTYTPVGNHEFQVELHGGSRTEVQRYTLNFNADFTIADGSLQPFRGDSLLLALGTAVLRAGDSNQIPISISATAALTNITFALDFETNRFSDVTLQPLIAELSSASISSPSPGRYVIRLQTGAGQALQGAQSNIAQLNFTTISNQPSGLLALRPQSFSASRLDGIAISNLFAGSGKVVIIGEEPLLEAMLSSNQTRSLVLYGKPGSSYAIESTANLASTNWAMVTRVPMASLAHPISGLDTNQVIVFYRAHEFIADPPLIEAHLLENQNRALRIFGKSGTQYELQHADSLSPSIAWQPLLTFTLTNSFGFVENLATNGGTFYRLRQ